MSKGLAVLLLLFVAYTGYCMYLASRMTAAETVATWPR